MNETEGDFATEDMVGSLRAEVARLTAALRQIRDGCADSCGTCLEQDMCSWCTADAALRSGVQISGTFGPAKQT